MAVDMEPKVGRIVVARAASTEFFPWFIAGGKITKISGHRVYYTKDGKETFTQGFAAICDTQKEVDKLLGFTLAGRARFEALKKELIKERMAAHPAAYYEGDYVPKAGSAAAAEEPEAAPEVDMSEVRASGRRRRQEASKAPAEAPARVRRVRAG